MSTAAAEKRVRCMKWVPKQEAGGSATIKACTSKRKRASSTAPASGSSPETPLPEDDKDGVDEQLESVGRSRSARKKPDLASGNDETVDVDDGEQDAGDRRSRSSQKRAVPAKKSKKKGGDDDVEHCFVGEPVPDDEAKKRWPERYQRKNAGKRAFAYGSTKKGDEEEELKARCHYWQAMVDNANLTQRPHPLVKSVNCPFWTLILVVVQCQQVYVWEQISLV